MKITEKEVLERIGAAIDEMDLDELADTYNYLTYYSTLDGADIEESEGWHLIPMEGAH